jgi:hypothetical protein
MRVRGHRKIILEYSDAWDNQLVVGAPYACSDTGASSGIVYIFEKSGNTWLETAKILPSDELGK